MLSRSWGLVTKRAASAVASTVTPRVTAQESVTRLPNGLTVASVDLQGATSQLLVGFRAGSRYEKGNERGVVHLVRNCVGKDSERYPGTTLIWNTALTGGFLSSSSTRDVFLIHLGIVRDNAPVGLSILGQLAKNAYKPWDVEDAKEFIDIDSVYRTPQDIVVDELHTAAFRNGPLSQNGFCHRGQVPGWKTLQEFTSRRFVSGEAVLVGVNIDHESLLHYATEQIPLNEGTATASPTSTYFGGETRMNFSGPSTHVALGGKGAALSDTKGVATQAVLSEIFYTAAKKIERTVLPININYQDAGLIGVQFNANNDEIGSLTKSVVSSLKNIKLDEDNVKAAKSKAILKVLSASECASSVAYDCAVQLLAGSSVTPSMFVDNINSLTQNDISKAATDSLSKMSMAVYGSTTLVPYLDEL